jgi:hypothetical protein
MGLGGSVPTFYWDATMVFGPVISLNAYVGFTSGLDAQGFGLLGQCGFFDQVRVVFDCKNGIFQIETPDPQSPIPASQH